MNAATPTAVDRPAALPRASGRRDLAGRVIIITGAGSGIGAATALACAAAGMDVVLNGRRADPLAAAAEQVRAAGRAAEIVAGDVTAPGMSARLLDAAIARFGRFDVVFANAGYGLYARAHRLADDALRRIFEVNFFAANDLLRLAANRLIADQRGGHLLMCSSVLAKFTRAELSAYTATKAAQNHVCRAMRLELRPYGIAVSSVHPTTTRTELFDTAVRATAALGPVGATPDNGPDWLVQPPEQVARAIVRCLRRPRAEVWTSWPIRLFAGLANAFPRVADLISAPQHAD